ncbi:MAG: hypothetical protein ACRCSF_11865 [Mycobacteriaceae bacterium]
MLVVTAEPEVTTRGYAELLGSTESQSLSVSNGSIYSVAPHENWVKSFALFEVADFAAARTLLSRRGHKTVLAAEYEFSPQLPIGPFATSEIAEIGIVNSLSEISTRKKEATVPHDISAIDHVVFTAPSRDKAVALFSGELDGDFRLEQQVSETVSQLFFRRGAIVIEVLVGLNDTIKLWGIAWRSTDIKRSHQRLTELNVPISEIRTGNKPGTQVFTVRDERLDLKNLIIAHNEK